MITRVPVSQADALLCASYQLYRHTGTNKTTIRTAGYGHPAALHAHVQTVAPTTYFASPRKSSINEAAVMVNATSEELKGVPFRCDDYITPSFLRSLYKTETYPPAAIDKNVLEVLGFADQYPSEEDFKYFMIDYRKDAVAATYTVEQVNNGGYDQRYPGEEANMNVQYAGAISFPTPQIFYSIGGWKEWSDDDGEPERGDAYLEWLRYILNEPTVPQTISISYGDPETDFPEEYVTFLCKLFARLGVRGVSVLVASGNEGVGSGACYDRSGRVRRFVNEFPASCTCGHLSFLAHSNKSRKSLTRSPLFFRSLCH